MNKEEKNMERYTLREGGRVLCPTERLEAALERLAAQVSPKAVLSVLAIKLGRS